MNFHNNVFRLRADLYLFSMYDLETTQDAPNVVGNSPFSLDGE